MFSKSSGNLNPKDLYTLHEYLVTYVFQTSLKNSSNSLTEKYVNGEFIKLTAVYSQNVEDTTALQVYLKSNFEENELEKFYMLIYRCLGVTMCLFVKGWYAIFIKFV